jgi:pyroglutamyl-peptidase
MRILLTGFEPFGGHAENPSMAVVRALASRNGVIGRVLPVVYADAGRIIRELIETERPDAVMSLGLCVRSSSIQLERIAINLCDDCVGDNAGDSAKGRLIEPVGPAAYFSTLPLTAMHAALSERGMPVAWSNHAGTYVCNHVFYTARHAIEHLGGAGNGALPCGFVHVPPVSDGGVGLPMLIDAIDTCLDVIAWSTPTK